MKTRASSLFPLLLMLGLAVMSFWLERAVQAPEHDKSGRSRHDPDFIAENFGITRMSGAGRPEYLISAKRMQHYPDDESTSIEAPRLVQNRDKGPPIIVSADRGLISSNGEEARFYGNVVVVRQAGKGEKELRVSTEYLHVMPERDIARTNRAVTITEGRSRLSGVGMEVNNKTRQFLLNSQVRGTFDVEK